MTCAYLISIRESISIIQPDANDYEMNENQMELQENDKRTNQIQNLDLQLKILRCRTDTKDGS